MADEHLNEENELEKKEFISSPTTIAVITFIFLEGIKAVISFIAVNIFKKGWNILKNLWKKEK